MPRVSPDDDWWRKIGTGAPEPPVEVRLDRADRGDQGGRFVAPFRGPAADGASHQQGNDDLDSLLEEVGRGIGAWAGNGIFDEKSQRQRGEGRAGGNHGFTDGRAPADGRRKGRRAGADAAAAGWSGDHQDPSADMPAVFGGTALKADAGDGDGVGTLTEEEVQTIRKLKEALQATRRKLDRAREDLNDVEDELEVREKEAADLRWEKEAADAERDRTRREYEKAQKAAKTRSLAAHRRASAMTRAGEGDDDYDDDVMMEDPDEAEKSSLARLYSRWVRWWRRLELRVRRIWRRRNPVRRAVVGIDQRFGSSTSVYFSFLEGLLNAAFLHFLVIYFPLILVPHAISLSSGAWDAAASPHLLANFYFSAFSTTVKIFYTIAVIISLAFYIVATYRHTISTYQRYAYESVFRSGSKKQVGFARQVLSGLDVSVSTERDLAEGRIASASVLLALCDESQWRETVRKRSIEDARRLFFRRALVLLSHLLLQVLIWAAVITVQLLSKDITTAVSSANSTSDFGAFLSAATVPLIITISNIIMPTITPMLVGFARYDNPYHKRLHKMVGFFFGRVLTLIVVLLTFVNGFNSETADIILPPVELEPGFNCLQDQLAQSLLIQVGFELVIPKISMLNQVFLFRVVIPRTISKGKKWSVFFKVEKQAIHCIYFQSLFWMLMPFMPVAAFLMVLAFAADFYFDRWFLITFCAKQTAGASSAAQSRVFAQYYLVSFAIFGMIYHGIWIMRGYMTAATVGPYSASTSESPYDELLSYSDAAASTFNFLLSLPVVVSIVVVLQIQKTSRSTMISFLQTHLEIQNAGFKFQFEAQGARIKKLRTENDRLRATADKIRKLSQAELDDTRAEVELDKDDD